MFEVMVLEQSDTDTLEETICSGAPDRGSIEDGPTGAIA